MGNLFVYDRETIYKQFLSPLTINQSEQLISQLSTLDEINLGYPYKVWLQCYYKKYDRLFEINGPFVLENVTEFIMTEYNVTNGFIKGEEWAILPMIIIYNMFSNQKHRKIIDTVLTSNLSDNFKHTINNYLLGVIV